jgi:hypothetical protein
VRSVHPEKADDGSAIVLWILSICMGLVAILGWLGFYRSSLRVTDEGLEKVTLLGRKLIAWPDVQVLEKRYDSDYFVKGENTTIAVKSFIPADWEELKETIAQRAINADGWQGTQNRSSGNEIAKNRQS